MEYEDDTVVTRDTVSALREIVDAIRSLGTNNAHTELGAIELLSKEIKEGLEHVADSFDRFTQAIKFHNSHMK